MTKPTVSRLAGTGVVPREIETHRHSQLEGCVERIVATSSFTLGVKPRPVRRRRRTVRTTGRARAPAPVMSRSVVRSVVRDLCGGDRCVCPGIDSGDLCAKFVQARTPWAENASHGDGFSLGGEIVLCVGVGTHLDEGRAEPDQRHGVRLGLDEPLIRGRVTSRPRHLGEAFGSGVTSPPRRLSEAVGRSSCFGDNCSGRRS